MNKHYDITIIGGGIAGAGVAQAAAAAGYSVLLIERGEFGCETSSASSKLIHGGLRYLESGQLSLVFSALKERKTLLNIAPTLVKAMPFYLPVYQGAQRRSLTLQIGLWLYAILGGLSPLSRFKTIKPSQWSQLKHLTTDKLTTVLQYWDGQTDDKKMTQAVINSAKALTATALTKCEFVSAIKNNGGYQVTFQPHNNLGETLPQKMIQTSMIINTAGPWVNQVLDKISPSPMKPDIDWVQGAHIIIDQPAKPYIIYLESPIDQRVVFVMPWQGKTLIGTTETLLTELPDKILPTQEEIDYLIALYQHYFPQQKVELLSSFAGVRVLPKHKKSAFSRPREALIYHPRHTPALITLCGGKLTTFRTTSKAIIKRVEQHLGKRAVKADIDKLILE